MKKRKTKWQLASRKERDKKPSVSKHLNIECHVRYGKIKMPMKHQSFDSKVVGLCVATVRLLCGIVPNE